MPVLEKFLEIIIQANNSSPKITGRLFAYNTSKNKFELASSKSAKIEFRNRWIFLLLNAAAILLRILDAKFLNAHQVGILNKTVEINICVTLCFICIVIGEGYRIRAKYPEDYLSFLNKTIEMELNLAKVQCIQSRINKNLTSAMYFFCLFHFCCDWIFPFALPISCVLEPSLPFNTIWLLDRIFGLTKFNGFIWNALIKLFSFLINSVVFKVLANRGLCIVADILIGVISLTIFVDKAHR